MVKYSLKKMLNKYPYFLDKRRTSNFFKVTKVNNEEFKKLYNDLFKVYESFHLNKNILVWKEQYEDYKYNINFVANYPLIKSVRIFKNDTLILREDYTEKEAKNSFTFTYTGEYVKSNYLEDHLYKCTECGELYSETSIPNECPICNNTEFESTKIYQCNNCENIIYDTPCEYCGSEDVTEIHKYICSNCEEEFYLENIPNECGNCGVETLIRNETLYIGDPNLICLDNSKDYSKPIIINTSIDETTGEDSDYTPSEELTPTEPSDEPTPFPINVTDELKIKYPVIPQDKFLIKVETYNEYTIVKGFPENDEQLINNYDHDYSLDEFGALNNIPRKKYIRVENEDSYHTTEPPYNDRLTEDDYHYMKRIIEYNLRMWASFNMFESKRNDMGYSDYINFLDKLGIDEETYESYKKDSRLFRQHYNPVTLEMWKDYGIKSELVNRERYLLKLFDENAHPFNESTGLVDCWTPQAWEHKDKFCDGTILYNEYFFVTCNNLRPIMWESVDFNFRLLNSIAEVVEEDYYVTIQYYYDYDETEIYDVLDSNGEVLNVTTPYCTLSWKLIDWERPTTFRFTCYRTDNSIIGDSVDVTVNCRNIRNADWYVDANANLDENDEIDPSYVGNGTCKYPFLTIQEALNKVRGSYNSIVLLSDIIIESPLIVTEPCIIIGGNKEHKDPQSELPGYSIITNNSTTPSKFFNIYSSKNIRFTLVNTTLSNYSNSNYIPITNWLTNTRDKLETVITSGGVCKIITVYNQNNYYPFDFINLNITTKNTKNEIIPNLPLNITFKNYPPISVTTDSNGELDYWLPINERYTNYYDLIIENTDTEHFNTQLHHRINIDKTPTVLIEPTGDLNLSIPYHSELSYEYFDVYYDNEYLDTVANIDGSSTSVQLTSGNHIIYTIPQGLNGESSVIDEWFVETQRPISILLNKTFIKDFTITDDLDIEYTTFTFTNDMVLGDLDGVLLDVNLNENGVLTVDTFQCNSSREEATNILYNEELVIKESIISMSISDTGDTFGDFTVERLGDL